MIKSLADVEDGDFVKFTTTDKGSKVSYVGEVIERLSLEDANWLTIQTFIGKMSFMVGKNDLEKCEAPVGWKKFKVNPDAYFTEQKQKSDKKIQEVVANTKTLKDKVFEYVKSNIKKKDAALIKECVAEFKAAPELVTVQVQLARLRLKKTS